MKIPCKVIEDLLPLYIEKIASDDSCLLIEGHIISCENCSKKLSNMRINTSIPLKTSAAPFIKIKANLQKKKYITILYSVLISLFFAVLGFAYLTAPEYIKYSKDMFIITEKNGSVNVQFDNTVTGFDIYCAENSSEYHIEAWDSILGNTLMKTTVPNTIINPNDEVVTSVYYDSNDGSESVLVYGVDQFPSGGMVVLPRLFLNYYRLLAFIVALVCGIALMLFRKNKGIANVVIKILFLSLAYLLSQFCIVGFHPISYSATRDFYAILLATFPLYFLILMVGGYIAKRKH